jgi:hypothetical protein
VQISIIYDSSVNNAPAAFKTDVNIAVQYLESLFTNSVTITIDVGYGEIDGQTLGSGDLGESEASQYVAESYTSVRNALIGEGAPGSSTLPTTSTLSGTLYMSQAEAKALGLPQNDLSIDGYVGFSSSPNIFGYGDGSAPPSNEYYFIGVVEHEITEDMGRVSFLNDQPNDYTLIDLYRYSSPGIRDTTTGGSGSTAYFSINNGDTNLGTWNNQTSNGDLADWYPDGPAPGGNDAFNDYSNPGVVNVVSQSDITLMEALGWASSSVNPAPPAGTTADMIMNDSSNGDYEIYDIGQNTVLAAYPLTQIGSPWQVAGLGGFNGADTTDMLMRNSSTGAFELYDVSNNNVTGSVSMGQVGLQWSVAGFGDFSSVTGETDMLMRNTTTGQFELYNISNNGYTGFHAMGEVGLEWEVAGFGDFSGNPSETDMLMRNTNTGAFEIYDISNNTYAGFHSMGQVGLEWSIAGFGDFSGNPGETDMLMRNTNTGQFEIYDISDNQYTGFHDMGQVGLEWSVAGFGDFSGNPGETGMLMRNTNTGAFEIYDISDNQYTGFHSMGQVALEWQVSGIAADPPSANGNFSGNPGAPSGGRAAGRDLWGMQLAQAMAEFGANGAFGTMARSIALSTDSDIFHAGRPGAKTF